MSLKYEPSSEPLHISGLQVPCTLYRGGGGTFAGKDLKISIDEVVRAGTVKSLGSFKVDLGGLSM